MSTVFICTTCQTRHPEDNIDFVEICGACNNPITGGRSGQAECNDCYSANADPTFHKSCMEKVEGHFFCKTHAELRKKRIEAAIIIEKYAKQFWGELGGKIADWKGSAEEKRRKFKVSFPALSLQVTMTPISKQGVHGHDIQEVASLQYEIYGIKKYGSKTLVAGIHSHQGALEELAEALLRSLRSKKAALVFAKRISYSSWPRWEKIEHNKTTKAIISMTKIIKTKLRKLRKSKVEPKVEPKVEVVVQPEIVS